MADTKISALTDGTTAQAADEHPIARSGANYKITNAYIKDYILGLANTWTAQNTFAAGTITTSQPFQVTQTWNAAGVTFTGLFANFTKTAAASGSKFLDIQESGTTMLSYTNAGVFTLGDPTGTFGGPTIKRSGSGQSINLAQNNNIYINNGGLGATIADGTSFGLGGGSQATDCLAVRDAANTWAFRNGTNAQAVHWYGNFVSSTDYHRGGCKVAKTTLSGVTGASVTATSLIPDGAVVVGVTTKVTTTLGNSGGTTGYQVGDGTDPDRWGEAAAITAGTTTDNTNATSTTVSMFTSANNVVITAVGGNFDGTGVIDVNVFYLIAQAD